MVIAEEIEPRSTDTEIEAAILQILDAGNRVLDVGGVRVQVTSRTLITDDDDDDRLTFPQLQTGDFLEIDGIRREDDSGVYLEATRIERDDDDDDDFELTARVDSVGITSFTILGITMNVDGGIEWDDGLDNINDLSEGMRVEVEYELRNNGMFYALEVEREDDDDDDDDD